MLRARCVRGVPGDRTVNSELIRRVVIRDGRPSESGVRKKTFCGNTPSFCNPIVVIVL